MLANEQGTFVKSYRQKGSQTNLWPIDLPGEFTCPNAVGAVINSNHCEFNDITLVTRFCLDRPDCIGFAYDEKRYYYQPTTTLFTASSRTSTIFTKAFLKIEEIVSDIADRPNEFTCPLAYGADLANSTFCTFNRKFDAENYCLLQNDCLGFLCLKEYCVLTRHPLANIHGNMIEETLATYTNNSLISPDDTTNSSVNSRILKIAIIAVLVMLIIFLCVLLLSLRELIQRRESRNAVSDKSDESIYTTTTISKREINETSLPPRLQLPYVAEVEHLEIKMVSSNSISKEPQNWSISQTLTWLESIGAPQSVVECAKSLNLDGTKLIRLLDHESSFNQLKIICSGEDLFTEDFLETAIKRLIKI